MTKALFALGVAAAFSGSFVTAACVGNDPVETTVAVQDAAPSTDAPAQGTSTSSTTSSSGGGGGGGGDDDSGAPATSSSGDAGPTVCKFQTTTFPCGGQNPPIACYSGGTSCTLTGCNVGDLVWACNSPRQCTTACCVANATATLTTAGCNDGILALTTNATNGATCSDKTTCEAGNTQLCQANSDCPAGQRCVPVKVANAPASFNGALIGACTAD